MERSRLCDVGVVLCPSSLISSRLCPKALELSSWEASSPAVVGFFSLREHKPDPFCLSGMVEMIPNAETLRKIQVEHGVTGSFKDRPLADWLQKHNPGEDEYEKVGWPPQRLRG